MKRHHITHREQIRPDIANHDFNIVADAVIHFTNATAAFVADDLFRREIMKTDIVDIATTECERDALLDGNRGLRQCQTHVTSSTYEYNLVFLRQSKRG